jgi:peptide/nickel transport system permease protein
MSHWQFLVRKFGWALFTILFVIVLNFFLFRIMPGDPARAGIHDPRLTAEGIEAIRVQFGLDKPVINCFESLNPIQSGSCWVNPLETQFFIYIGNTLRGDWGISFQSSRPVTEFLLERLWNTILLIGVGQILAITFGMLLGILAAYRAGTPLDFGALVTSLVAWSLPTFWLGIILLFIGSSSFGLPLAGKSTPGAAFASVWAEWLDVGRHMLLPTLAFTLIFMGEYMLIMRSSLLEVLSEDYILTARAKGLHNFQILKDHALKNAMLPMVTLIAINLGFTVAGAVQIETVFSWPGLGEAIFEAVKQRDFPVLQGAFLLIAISVILANSLADLSYSYLDPRVRIK